MRVNKTMAGFEAVSHVDVGHRFGSGWPESSTPPAHLCELSVHSPGTWVSRGGTGWISGSSVERTSSHHSLMGFPAISTTLSSVTLPGMFHYADKL